MIAELDHNYTHIDVTSGAMRHKLFVGYFVSGGGARGSSLNSPYNSGACGHVWPWMDAGCCYAAIRVRVSPRCRMHAPGPDGRMSCDDASFLLNSGTDRTGDGQLPSGALPAVGGGAVSGVAGTGDYAARCVGKPSIELPTALLPKMVCAQIGAGGFHRLSEPALGGAAGASPYRKDVARHFMRQALYGTPKSLAVQYEAIERLLTVDVFELRYSDLDWAVDRLQRLVREGR